MKEPIIIPVDRYTRAGKDGRIIICPHCSREFVVSHFSFSALVCLACGKEIDKYDLSVYRKVIDKTKVKDFSKNIKEY